MALKPYLFSIAGAALASLVIHATALAGPPQSAASLDVSEVTAEGDVKLRAREFIQELAAVTTKSFQDGSKEAPSLEKVDTFIKQHYLQRLDFRAIGERVVGSAWTDKKTSEADRVEFIETYKKWLLHSFSLQFLRFSKDKIRVSNPDGINVLKPSGDVIVPTQLVSAAGNRQIVAWRVTMGTEPKLVDVIIDQISLQELHRSQFSKPLIDGGLKGLTELISKRLPENMAGK
ncbi:MAG: ABC transporter substrate-binding protein [Proteobacteria bacterium]|nr:ABC transporter substrate-binding protein [Pseudomonadota bacterium]